MARLTVSPPNGQNGQYTTSGQRIETVAFQFDISKSSVERDGNNLIISTPENDKIVISDFFVTSGGTLPALELADGSVVPGTFLASLNTTMDLSTAAGPTTATPDSGGSSYHDAAGTLLGGLERLGSLGTDHWSGERGAAEMVQSPTLAMLAGQPGPGAAAGGEAAGGADGGSGGGTTPVVTDERFVMYMDTVQTGLAMQGLAQAKNHSAANISGDAPLYGTVSIVNGKLHYELNQTGVDALNAASAPVVDYVTYIDANGLPHTVQVVLTTDSTFISQNFSDPARPGFQPGEETHFSHKEGSSYTVQSTNGNDVLTFSKEVKGGDINTQNGDDTVHVTSRVIANAAGEATSITVNSAGSLIDIEANTGAGKGAVHAGTNFGASATSTINLNLGGGTLEISNTTGSGIRTEKEGEVNVNNVGTMVIDAKEAGILAHTGTGIAGNDDKTRSTININMADGGSTADIKGSMGIAAQFGEVSITGGSGYDVLNISGEQRGIGTTNASVNIRDVEEINITTKNFGLNTWGTPLYTDTQRITGAEKITITGNDVADNGAAMRANSTGATPNLTSGIYLETAQMNVTMNTGVAGNKVFGMSAAPNAQAGGATENHITANGESLQMNMNVVNTANADNAYAMYTSGNKLSNNKIIGGEGADTIDITGRIYAHSQSVTDGARTGGNVIETGAGADKLTITSSASQGALAVSGADVQNRIDMGSGNDTVVIAGAVVSQNKGKNLVDAGEGDDSVSITSILSQTEGIVHVAGGAGKDTIHVGSIVNDSATVVAKEAGSINDTANQPSWTVHIDGGAGDDSIRIDSIQGKSTVVAVNDANTGQHHFDMVYSNTYVQGGNGNDTLDIGALSHVVVDGGGGNDLITVGVMEGGKLSGDDRYRSGDQNGIVTPDAGEDTIRIGTLKSGVVSGDSGQWGGGKDASIIKAASDNIHIGTMEGGFVAGDFAGEQWNCDAANDTITVTTMTGGAIAGDAALAAGDPYVNRLATYKAGNDSIEIGSMANAVIYGDFKTIGSPSYTKTMNVELGNDTITVKGDVTSSTIFGDAGWQDAKYGTHTGGHDSIHIQGSLINSEIFGDMTDTGVQIASPKSVDGNDTITIDKNVVNSLISGDSARSWGNYQSGADSIHIKGNVTDSRIAGDLTEAVKNSDSLGYTFANDIISVDGVMRSTTISGDLLVEAKDNLKLGNDNIFVHEMQSGTIYGDAQKLSGSSVGGNDTIKVNTLVSGLIAGDAQEMRNTSRGGDDSITVGTMNGGHIVGDAFTDFYGGNQGGNDTITVDKLTGGFVSGDFHVLAVHGGDDSIHIKEMTGGKVAGDSTEYTATDQGAERVSYGNDSIRVDTLTGGVVAGDVADDTWAESYRISWQRQGDWTRYHGSRDRDGGNDTIEIGTMDGAQTVVSGDIGAGANGNPDMGNDSITISHMKNGLVFGDAKSSGTGGGDQALYEAGHDTITVGVMDNGKIYGDSGTAWGYVEAGNDSITVHEMRGGSIYGDIDTTGLNINSPGYFGMSHGSDTITVGNFVDNGVAKYIDGGFNSIAQTQAGVLEKTLVEGHDVFVYNDTVGHTIALEENGTAANWKVFIDGDLNYHGATIINFEGIGGGSGNDTLFGNSGMNTLIGGAGDDLLTGGGGADTFVWRMGDAGTTSAPSRDIVTDFSLTDNDKLDLSDLLQDATLGTLDDYLVIRNDGQGNTILQINSSGNASSGQYDQLITLEGVTASDHADIIAQIILNS